VLKTEALRLVRKFAVLSLMLFSLAVMSLGVGANRVLAAPPCCSYCEAFECQYEGVGCNISLRACYRHCVPTC
jgi:hypothetical protein